MSTNAIYITHIYNNLVFNASSYSYVSLSLSLSLSFSLSSLFSLILSHVVLILETLVSSETTSKK